MGCREGSVEPGHRYVRLPFYAAGAGSGTSDCRETWVICGLARHDSYRYTDVRSPDMMRIASCKSGTGVRRSCATLLSRSMSSAAENDIIPALA